MVVRAYTRGKDADFIDTKASSTAEEINVEWPRAEETLYWSVTPDRSHTFSNEGKAVGGIGNHAGDGNKWDVDTRD